jgi:hypothetical protein
MDRSEEVKAILQKACDRDWKDETLYQTAIIAANAIYWRGKEIEALKGQPGKALAARPEVGFIQRYSLDAWGYKRLNSTTTADGEWVKWEDVKHLLPQGER